MLSVEDVFEEIKLGNCTRSPDFKVSACICRGRNWELVNSLILLVETGILVSTVRDLNSTFYWESRRFYQWKLEFLFLLVGSQFLLNTSRLTFERNLYKQYWQKVEKEN